MGGKCRRLKEWRERRKERKETEGAVVQPDAEKAPAKNLEFEKVEGLRKTRLGGPLPPVWASKADGEVIGVCY